MGNSASAPKKNIVRNVQSASGQPRGGNDQAKDSDNANDQAPQARPATVASEQRSQPNTGQQACESAFQNVDGFLVHVAKSGHDPNLTQSPKAAQPITLSHASNIGGGSTQASDAHEPHNDHHVRNVPEGSCSDYIMKPLRNCMHHELNLAPYSRL